MARTTIAIEDTLLRQVRLRAAREDRSLQSVVNDLLRRALQSPAPGPFKLKLGSWDAKPNPGVDLANRSTYFDLLDRAGDRD